MRLVKLSPSVFKNESELQDFFDNGLGNQKPKGLFIFRGRHIAPNGLYPGETVLFSYRNKLRFVAKAETGRKDNVYGKRKKYHYCFVIKLPVRKTCVSLEEVERKLHIQADFQKSLSGQVWTKIADSEQAERVIVNLPSAVSTAQSSNSMPDQSPAKIPVRVKQYFTQYWTNDTWNKNAYLEGQDLNYTAGNLFARSKVCSGDSVYIVTVFAGRLFLLGRLTVDRICSRREWKKFHSKDEVWPARDHVRAASGTPRCFNRKVSQAITKKLKFITSSGKLEPPKYVKHGHLNQQTLRRVRKLEPASARLLDELLLADNAIPIDLPEAPSRSMTQVYRITRDSKLVRDLKSLYDFACQVCGLHIKTLQGSPYIEVHHVQALGGDHAGLDIQANMLVLCPNHHAMFDLGIPRFLSPKRIEIEGVAHNLITKHELLPQFIEYHNSHSQTLNL